MERKELLQRISQLKAVLREMTVRNIQLNNRIDALVEENSMYILGSLMNNGKCINRSFTKK